MQSIMNVSESICVEFISDEKMKVFVGEINK